MRYSAERRLRPGGASHPSLMPFTFPDVLMMAGLAVAATLFIFLLVNPPEFVVYWLTGKKKQKR